MLSEGKTVRLFLSFTDTDDIGWTIHLPCIPYTTIVSLLLVSWICQDYFPFCSHYVSPLCVISTAFYKSDLPWSLHLSSQAQDSWSLHSLAYQLLILTHSDFKLLFNAGMANRFYVAYTSNWLVVTIGNTELSIASSQGLTEKLQNKLIISPLDQGRGKGYGYVIYFQFLVSCI